MLNKFMIDYSFIFFLNWQNIRFVYTLIISSFYMPILAWFIAF